MSDEESVENFNSGNPLPSEEIEGIRSSAIEHVATVTYKKTLARLEQSPEYHNKSDEEKKKLAYETVKCSLNESYGSTLRTRLIKINHLESDIIEDLSDIMIAEGQSETDAEEPEDGEM